MAQTFRGWSPAALDFYRRLEAENTRPFWLANKATFDVEVRAPFDALSELVAEEFGPLHVFRPNRDVRFSKDKSPYKTRCYGVAEGERGEGYYVGISAQGLSVGSGAWMMARDQLARYRAAVDDPVAGPELEALVADVRRQRLHIEAQPLKTAPRGYPRDHPRIELLRAKSLAGRARLRARCLAGHAQGRRPDPRHLARHRGHERLARRARRSVDRTALGPLVTPDVVVVGLGLIGAGALRHLAADGVDVVGIGPARPRHLDPAHRTAATTTRAASPGCSTPATSGPSWRGRHRRVPDDRAGRRHRVPHAGRHRRRVGRPGPHRPARRGGPPGRRSTGCWDRRPPGLPTTEDGRVLVADGRLALPAGSTVVAEPGPAGFIDPRRMLAAQLAAAEGHGATVIPAAVVNVARNGSSWRVHRRRTPGRAPQVLVTTGAHTDELSPLAGRFGGQVRPETVVIATLAPDEAARLARIPSVLAHLGGSSFADLYQVPPTTYPDGTIGLKLGATLRSGRR